MKYDLGALYLALWATLAAGVVGLVLLLVVWRRVERPALSSWAEIEREGGGA